MNNDGYNSGARKGVGLVFQIRGDAGSLLVVPLACPSSGPCAFPPRDLASQPFDHLRYRRINRLASFVRGTPYTADDNV